MSLPKTNSIFDDAFGTLVMRVVGIALVFVTTMVTARLFGPAEYGVYSASLGLASLMAAIAPLGSDRILVRNLSITKCSIEMGRETAIAHICTGIITAILVVGLFAGWAVSSFIYSDPVWARTAALAALMFVPRAFMSLRQWLAIPIIGSQRAVIPELAVLPFMFTVSLLILAAVGLRLTASTAAVVYAGTVGMVWLGASQAASIRCVYSSAWKSRVDIGRGQILGQLRNGLPFVSVGIGAVLIQSCMPIVIAMTCGFKDAAFFALAFSYAGLAMIALPAFNLSMIPRCARLYNRGDFGAAQHAVRSAATLTFCLAVTLSFLMWICSPLLTILLGTEYSMVCRLLPPLLLSMIVDCLTGPTNPVMQTMKMEKTHSRTLLAFIPIQFGAVYLFGNLAGIEGAALAMLISRCLWNAFIFTRILQVRGLVMLPYPDFRKAFIEYSPALESEIAQRRSVQSLWQAVPIPEASLSQVRAA
jgi:O-antigen/teichoic acid export membrane protein